jgi:hypothetical protein
MINLSKRYLVVLGVVALVMIALGFAFGIAITPGSRLPRTCGDGDVLRWDGEAWACATAVKIKAGRVEFNQILLAAGTEISDTLVVQFDNDEPFSQAPTVIVSLAQIDARDVRIKVEATHVTKDQFTVERTTWDYTELWWTHVTWIAFGV